MSATATILLSVDERRAQQAARRHFHKGFRRSLVTRDGASVAVTHDSSIFNDGLARRVFHGGDFAKCFPDSAKRLPRRPFRGDPDDKVSESLGVGVKYTEWNYLLFLLQPHVETVTLSHAVASLHARLIKICDQAELDFSTASFATRPELLANLRVARGHMDITVRELDREPWKSRVDERHSFYQKFSALVATAEQHRLDLTRDYAAYLRKREEQYLYAAEPLADAVVELLAKPVDLRALPPRT